MNAAFREALRDAYQANNAVYTDFQPYDALMEKFAAEDMLSYSLPRTCLLIPEEMNKLHTACADNNTAKATEICQEIERILRNEHGIRPYHAVWAINCWLYAINGHMCYFNFEYAKALEDMPSDKLIPLGNSGDAYAACTLYARDTNQKEWLTRIEQYDHPASMYYQAVELHGDFSDPERNRQSLGLCLKALDMGYTGVIPELAFMYQGVEGIEKDTAESFKYALMGADLGFPACMRMVSNAYWNGDGVETNPHAGFSYLEKLAESGDVRAQCMCGCAHYSGDHGAVKDLEKSFYWLKKSADQGYGEAQMLAGESLLQGAGVPANASEALRYFKASADQGNIKAMEQIARMYFLGEGISKNEEEAASWYKKAADAGSGYACSLLADMYKAGIGVPRNLARADQYNRKAKELGYEEDADEPEEETHESTSEVDLNDPTAQARIRAFASSELESMGIDDTAGINFIDDNWDLENLGKGDGITDIRDPDVKELFYVMRDTWKAFASIVEKHGLVLYKDQGRAYMYMLSKLAIEFCNKKIPNFPYYLLNFLYGSSCRSFMDDSAADYFNKEFTIYSEKFDDIHRKGNDLTTTVLIYLYLVNTVLGKYSDDVAKEVSAEQPKYLKQFLVTIQSIAEKRHID